MQIFYSFRKARMEIFEMEDSNSLTHLHNEIEILFVKQGNINVMIDAKEYALTEGALSIAMPNTIHSIKSVGPSKVIFVIFRPDLIQEYKSIFNKRCLCPVLTAQEVHADILFCLQGLIDRLPVANAAKTANRNFPNVSSEVPLMFKDFSGESVGEDHPDIYNGLLKGYLYLLFSRVMQKMQLVSLPDTTTAYVIQSALRYVCDHFKKSITLKELSEHLDVSHYYISRVFNRYVGCGFCEYLNRLRIEYSQCLLVESEMTIMEIAFDCGFDSQRNFNRVFKSLVGLSPSEYRTHHGEIIREE